MRSDPGVPPLLELKGVAKRFGGVRALRNGSLSVSGPGVVHGLIGENGSGKSTTLGIISGQIQPDAGVITMGGEVVRFAKPLDAIAHGIAMVSQETALAPALSVAENIFLGHRQVRARTGIDWNATRENAATVLARIGLDIDPSQITGSLSPDRQQMVEIARALSMDARVLILDEPTSSLTDDQVEALFGAVTSLKAHGVSIIFVSHRLKEMFHMVDELTVLRDGCTAAEGPMSEFDVHRVIEEMTGSEVGEPVPSSPHTGFESSGDARPPALAVKGLSVADVLHDIDLDLAPGEIVGVAGLVGAGRSELLEAIFGLRAPASGTIQLHGVPHRPRSARDAIAKGIGYLPPDRKGRGVVLGRSVADNLTMVATSSVGRLRLHRRSRTAQLVADAMASMRVRAASPDVPVGTLSGGNQQKVALGKWIAAKSRILLLDEPTRGVDVAAKAEIHSLLRDAAAGGAALLVSSSENSELLDLCDRIVVMFRGSVVASIPRKDATEALLGRYAGGHVSV